MDLEVMHDRENKAFFVQKDDKTSYLKYRDLGDNVLEFYSTYVDPVFRGQGIAAKLVEAGIAFAKESSCKIVPTCSYVNQYFARKKELADIIAN